jgi:hypothetical protein
MCVVDAKFILVQAERNYLQSSAACRFTSRRKSEERLTSLLFVVEVESKLNLVLAASTGLEVLLIFVSLLGVVSIGIHSRV